MIFGEKTSWKIYTLGQITYDDDDDDDDEVQEHPEKRRKTF